MDEIQSSNQRERPTVLEIFYWKSNWRTLLDAKEAKMSLFPDFAKTLTSWNHSH